MICTLETVKSIVQNFIHDVISYPKNIIFLQYFSNYFSFLTLHLDL